ncbi:MAG: hypothetical protein M3Q29_21065, partial [Chloroflexota bacterium]|nr:hypothetical protein [Chloroflexota bacterium]
WHHPTVPEWTHSEPTRLTRSALSTAHPDLLYPKWLICEIQTKRETQREALREHYRAIRPILEDRPILAWEPEIAAERRIVESLSEKVSGHPQSDVRLSVEDYLGWLHKLALEVEKFVAALPEGELDQRIEEGMATLRKMLDPAGHTTRGG